MNNKYITKRLEEFIREFCNDHNGKVRFLRGVFYDEKDGAERIMNFLSESIQQAVAEERDRLVREARQTLKKEDSDIVERVIASLDKPVTKKNQPMTDTKKLPVWKYGWNSKNHHCG